MKLLRWLIIAALLVFPFGELLRLDLANNITIKPLDVIAGLTTLVWLVLAFSKRIKNPKIQWYYFVFPLVALASLLINLNWLQTNQIFSAALYLIRWISYLGVFLAFIQFDAKFKIRVELLLFFDGLIIVLLGFIQYFFFSNLKPLYYLGWDDHMYRLFSVFLDPNFTGAILVLYVLYLGGMLYKTLGKSGSKFSKISLTKKISISKKKFTGLVSLSLVLGLIALFLTFSRSSLIMLIIGASVFLILIGRKKLILLLIGMLTVVIILISPFFYVENINLFRHASTDARVGNYEAAFSIIRQTPLFGVGFNTYRYAKDRYNIQSGWLKTPSHADAGVDNSFLFVLATTGIVGLVSYLIFWFCLFKNAVVSYRDQKNIYAAVFIASGVGIFMHAMFINSLFFPAVMFWLWMIYGLKENN